MSTVGATFYCKRMRVSAPPHSQALSLGNTPMRVSICMTKTQLSPIHSRSTEMKTFLLIVPTVLFFRRFTVNPLYCE